MSPQNRRMRLKREGSSSHKCQPDPIANGYMSFWVRSAKETYDYLKENGCSFPVIPAINDKSGIDKQAGYTQVVTTDSEGSVIIFTEYSVRSR